MKKTVKIILGILASLMLLISFAACSQSDVPEGYQLVACEGDEFRLYVPTQWIVNTTSGTTSAYYTSDAEIAVTVNKTDDANGLSLEEYWEKCDGQYKAELDGYSYDGNLKKVVLGGKSGHRRVFSAKVTKFSEIENKNVTKEYKFLQVMAQNNADTYVLTYYAPSDTFDTLLEVVEGNALDEGIIPYFRFAEPYHSEENDKEFDDNVKAPEGMKIASTNERPYILFVPKEWKINNKTDATAAYASDTDSSNVNVGMHMTSNTAETVSDHWKKLEESYKNTFLSYTLTSDEEIKMGGISARKYSYTVVSGGQEYKLIQAIVRKGEMFYYLTYTALPENYEKHLSDVDKMIANFSIK